MKHLLIKDRSLNGWEYGMLRSFEQAIVSATGAEILEIPEYTFAPDYMHHFGQGMKRSKYRKYFPKRPLQLQTDVAWYILMGPENYRLDLFKGWEGTAKTKIVYLFDTLPAQYPTIKRLFSDNTWDILITSFNDAVEDLQQLTGRKWYCLPQAADSSLFTPVPAGQRTIHFSAYGRRYPVLHEAVMDFCRGNGLYYDYTTHDARHPTADSPELYRQYAWHVAHSLFNFSWPVELTNPARAGHLHPVTCRWFESAAAGTVILGRAPGNPIFAEWLDKDLVVDIDPGQNKQQLLHQLDRIWNTREDLLQRALDIRNRKMEDWTWQRRVDSVLSWIEALTTNK